MSSQKHPSLSLADSSAIGLNIGQKIGAILGMSGIATLLIAGLNNSIAHSPIVLMYSILALLLGILLYARSSYLHLPAGVQNNGVFTSSLTHRGLWAWIIGLFLTGFYVLLNGYPHLLGLGDATQPNTGLVALFDPLSILLNGKPASQWFVYGSLYTIAILGMGYKFILKYRHNKYQIIRTLSVMFFQFCFAFLLPELLSKLNPEIAYFNKDIKNMWPLNYYFFENWHLTNLLSSGLLGKLFLGIGLSLIFVISPLLTYFYGKRWYCAWVCGCGGLAETAGDPFRHLSDKTTRAWKLERWLIHSVLLFIILVTISVILSFIYENPTTSPLSALGFKLLVAGLLLGIVAMVFIFKRKEMARDGLIGIAVATVVILALLAFIYDSKGSILGLDTWQLRSWYGFMIGACFSGVIGVGFYPLLGSRVWCRFGCPMAAVLGFQQRIFSRFRITTNSGQCISCGNCSTYCEMGIDVRAYAQRGDNIVRSSCVGCGICATVCPRGVLKLENGAVKDRFRVEDIYPAPKNKIKPPSA